MTRSTVFFTLFLYSSENHYRIYIDIDFVLVIIKDTDTIFIVLASETFSYKKKPQYPIIMLVAFCIRNLPLVNSHGKGNK